MSGDTLTVVEPSCLGVGDNAETATLVDGS